METFDKAVVALVNLAGFGFLFAATASVMLQIYLWLFTGQWLNLSLVGVLALMHGAFPHAATWAAEPSTWIGLHRLLDLVPTWVPVAFFGYTLTHIE